MRPETKRVLDALDQNADAPLERLLKLLIAAYDGVPPEDVTLEYIAEQREQRFYPRLRYDVGDPYGGYDPTGLKFLSRDELHAMCDRAARFLQRFEQ